MKDWTRYLMANEQLCQLRALADEGVNVMQHCWQALQPDQRAGLGPQIRRRHRPARLQGSRRARNHGAASFARPQ